MWWLSQSASALTLALRVEGMADSPSRRCDSRLVRLEDDHLADRVVEAPAMPRVFIRPKEDIGLGAEGHEVLDELSGIPLVEAYSSTGRIHLHLHHTLEDVWQGKVTEVIVALMCGGG